MQTIRIIIVKRNLNYVKNEVTMTDYDRRQSRSRSNTSANLLFYSLRAVPIFPLEFVEPRCLSPKLFRQSLFRWTEQYLWSTTMFYFNADNAAARKLRDRRSASCSSIPGLQWINKLFNGAMARNVAPSCRPGPGLVNTIFAESWGQYGNVFSVIQLF